MAFIINYRRLAEPDLTAQSLPLVYTVADVGEDVYYVPQHNLLYTRGESQPSRLERVEQFLIRKPEIAMRVYSEHPDWFVGVHCFKSDEYTVLVAFELRGIAYTSMKSNRDGIISDIATLDEIANMFPAQADVIRSKAEDKKKLLGHDIASEDVWACAVDDTYNEIAVSPASGWIIIRDNRNLTQLRIGPASQKLRYQDFCTTYPALKTEIDRRYPYFKDTYDVLESIFSAPKKATRAVAEVPAVPEPPKPEKIKFEKILDPDHYEYGDEYPGRVTGRENLVLRKNDHLFWDFVSKVKDGVDKSKTETDQARQAGTAVRRHFTTRISLESEDGTPDVVNAVEKIVKKYAGQKTSIGAWVALGIGCCRHEALTLWCIYLKLGFKATLKIGYLQDPNAPADSNAGAHAWVEVEIGGVTYIADSIQNTFSVKMEDPQATYKPHKKKYTDKRDGFILRPVSKSAEQVEGGNNQTVMAFKGRGGEQDTVDRIIEEKSPGQIQAPPPPAGIRTVRPLSPHQSDPIEQPQKSGKPAEEGGWRRFIRKVFP